MKRIFTYISGSLAALMIVSSCNVLETESPSTFDASVVYANYTLAEGTVFAISESFCEVNSYRGRFLPWYGFNTDIEWYNAYSKGKPEEDKTTITNYAIKTGNGQLNTNSNGITNNPYVLMYTGIERANLAIEGIRQYADLKDRDMQHLLGEALTLRAMIYYDLIKAWGDVPARFEPISSETIYVKKTNRDVIYKRILGDLDEAIPYLYYPNESSITTRTDRVNRLFAEGLYARIALAASGYALRTEDGMEGTGDMGTVRLSTDPDLQKEVLYPKALGYLKDAIESGKAGLVADYEQLWRDFNSFDLTAGKEVLYVIPFSNSRGRWNYTFAIKNEGATINGYAFSQGGQAGPVPSFYFNFAADDTRRDVTCVNYGWEKSGAISPAGIAKWYFGKYRFEWMDNNPYTGGNDDGAKPVVMRYSDILLMAAEIANECDNLADAKEYFKQVRARATGEASADAYVEAIGGKEAMFNAIVDERAFEFCGEFLRKADLIRWNLLKTKLDKAKADMYDLRDKKGAYDWLTGDLYYRLADDEESLQMWGLRKGEQTAPSGGDWELTANYVKYDDAKGSDLYAERIDNIYLVGVTPEQRMYWPIFDCNIVDSQGTLVNDFGY